MVFGDGLLLGSGGGGVPVGPGCDGGVIGACRGSDSGRGSGWSVSVSRGNRGGGVCRGNRESRDSGGVRGSGEGNSGRGVVPGVKGHDGRVGAGVVWF